MYIRISSDDMVVVFIHTYYDGPVSGLCKVNNKLHYFQEDNSTNEYICQPLSFTNKIRFLLDKKVFEFCVGDHYNATLAGTIWKNKPYWLQDKLTNFYYDYFRNWIRKNHA